MNESFSKKMKKKGLTKHKGCKTLIINDLELMFLCPDFSVFLPIYRDHRYRFGREKGKKGN